MHHTVYQWADIDGLSVVPAYCFAGRGRHTDA
jgi:hypothetical protein